MKHQSILTWLISLIAVLALVAASFGLFDTTEGQSFSYTNHRGETVMIHGQGLYYYDSLSSAAQMQANDLISLILGLPLLILSTVLAFRGSLRGQLLLTGTLGFFLYTYLSMSMLTSYNRFFLVYVGLFTLSFYAFILAFLSFDLDSLPKAFSSHFPYRWIAALLILVGAFFALAWIGRIIPEIFDMQSATLENTTTRVIQALDLGLLMPIAFIAAFLLLRQAALGYLLASVLIMKSITMGLAVSTMGINMALVGVPDSLGIVIPFIVLTLLNLWAGVVLLRCIEQAQAPNNVTSQSNLQKQPA